MGVDTGGEMVLNARVFRTAAENRSGLGMAHREVRVFFDTWACRSGAKRREGKRAIAGNEETRNRYRDREHERTKNQNPAEGFRPPDVGPIGG